MGFSLLSEYEQAEAATFSLDEAAHLSLANRTIGALSKQLEGYPGAITRQIAGRRLTHTIPTATNVSAMTSPFVTGSPSHNAPNSNANIGVKKTNTEILVAG